MANLRACLYITEWTNRNGEDDDLYERGNNKTLRKLVSMEFSVSMIYLNIDHLLEILFLY
jgi:hypothetical protein